jgi:hypothetical protein
MFQLIAIPGGVLLTIACVVFVVRTIIRDNRLQADRDRHFCAHLAAQTVDQATAPAVVAVVVTDRAGPFAPAAPAELARGGNR